MPGLPPVVMQSARDDPLSIDADRIETAVAATGTGVVDHHRFDNLWHVFHLQAGVLAEADEAITDLGVEAAHPYDRTKGCNEMSSFDGKVAVITGAGSGMALARNLAKKGAKLALSDIDAEGLADTVRQAEALGAEVKSDRLNVAEREAVLAYADDVVGHFGR